MKMSDEEFALTLEELGVIRMCKYLKAYKSIVSDRSKLESFIPIFREYLDSKSRGKDGYLRISIFSFKSYVFDKFSS